MVTTNSFGIMTIEGSQFHPYRFKLVSHGLSRNRKGIRALPQQAETLPPLARYSDPCTDIALLDFRSDAISARGLESQIRHEEPLLLETSPKAI